MNIWEVFTKKKHICHNRVNNNKPVTVNTSIAPAATTTTSNTKPTYYSKKHSPYLLNRNQRYLNSFEFAAGVQWPKIERNMKFYTDIVIVEHGGKVIVINPILLMQIIICIYCLL